MNINRGTADTSYTAVLTVTDQSGCRVSTDTQTFVIPALSSGKMINNNQIVSAISVYPNPTSNLTNVKMTLGTLTEKVDIRVYNTMGVQVALQHVATANRKELTAGISMGGLPTGMYFIKAFNNEGALVGATSILKH